MLVGGKVKICSQHAFPYRTRKCVKSARALSITNLPESPRRIADGARDDRVWGGGDKKNTRVLFHEPLLGPIPARPVLFSYYPKFFSVSMARNSSKQRAVKRLTLSAGPFINSRGSFFLSPLRCVFANCITTRLHD